MDAGRHGPRRQGCRPHRRPGPAGHAPRRNRPAGSLRPARGESRRRAPAKGRHRRPQGPPEGAGRGEGLARRPRSAQARRETRRRRPANVLTGPKGLWAAADAIWIALGDKSTDFNWYTKRTILSGVLGSTLAAWIGTDDEAQIDAFLDRRIENVMQFEKFKGQVKDAFAKAPNPMDLFGQRK
ncbi:MAG: COQ9 family protein [Hyphomonadaceae bacterium]|nr:COQ9 family protein [Hyphomonadaceae bacterium]